MTNQSIKENLVVLFEDYSSRCSDKHDQVLARRSVVLACKAIDAYGGVLDETECSHPLMKVDKISPKD